MQTWPTGHRSSSSHLPGVTGVHAEMQLSQSGQLEVAQNSQTIPGPQLGQKSSPQRGAQVPVEKTQTPAGQSVCAVQPTEVMVVEPLVTVTLPVVDVDPEVDPVSLLVVPALSTTTLPPQPARRRARPTLIDTFIESLPSRSLRARVSPRQSTMRRIASPFCLP